MRIMVGVGHPKHVHFWKNIIKNLMNDGHEVKIVARVKDVTLYLLDAYGFDYVVVGKNYKGFIKKAYGIIETDFRMLKVAKKFKPDILAMGTPYLAQVSKLIGKPHISLLDTEHATLTYRLAYPFTDVICTPSCIKKKINPKKHVTFNGYMELAYLHPNYFKPDPTVLDDLGLSKGDKFIILRFVSWGASHDVGQHGFDLERKLQFVKRLGKYSSVLITSEQSLEKKFEKHRITIPPEKIHDLLYYASLYAGEGGAMATEAGILGTPSIYVSSLVGTMGNFEELEENYGLVYAFKDSTLALEKALELLDDKDIKNKWKKKREKLLDEKIDVTKFMTDFIENYPNSSNGYKEGHI